MAWQGGGGGAQLHPNACEERMEMAKKTEAKVEPRKFLNTRKLFVPNIIKKQGRLRALESINSQWVSRRDR